MPSNTNHDEVVLRFYPLRDSVPWPNRVRLPLKYALRACNLRCVRVKGLPNRRKRLDQWGYASASMPSWGSMPSWRLLCALMNVRTRKANLQQKGGRR